ncbi:hypothetical protein [Roseovarius sp.]|uniref:hypothetical protein n=1 Tax=Roseovarius sp. TaxID=1486281 RepID=UPI0035680C25
MTDLERLKIAVVDAGFSERVFTPVYVTRMSRPLCEDEDLHELVDGGRKGWIRWRSALIAGDRLSGNDADRGPAIAGEWVLDTNASARLVFGPNGVAMEISELREHAQDGSEPEGALAALREVVHLRTKPERRLMRRHIFWTLDPHDEGALGRHFDRLAEIEGVKTCP